MSASLEGESYEASSQAFFKSIEQTQLAERLEAQAARWHETCQYMAGYGNKESEIVTLLVLWRAALHLSSWQLFQEVVKAQGQPAGWIPDNTVPFGYCQNSFEPVGVVSAGYAAGEHGEVDAYRINDQKKQITAAACGWLGLWSLCYTDISLQQAVGSTGAHDTIRAPEVRLNIFLDLLTHPNKEVGTQEIEGISDVLTTGVVDTAVRHLVDSGLIEKKSAWVNNDRKYQITDPYYRGQLPFNRLHPVNQAAYRFFNTMQPGDTFTHQQVLDYVVSSLDPSVDPLLVRSKLAPLLRSESTRFPGVIRLEKYHGRAYQTRLHVKPQHERALKDLVSIVLMLDAEDQDFLESGVELAQTIIDDKVLVAALMAKSDRFSPHTEGDKEKTLHILSGIISHSLFPLDCDDIHREYNAVPNRKPLSRAIVARYLRELCQKDNNAITRAPGRPDPTSRRTKYFYSGLQVNVPRVGMTNAS